MSFALNLPNATYRAERAPWVGTPGGRPALAARRHGDTIHAWASRNGATQIPHWRLLAGRDPRRLRSCRGAANAALATAKGFDPEAPRHLRKVTLRAER